MCARGKVAHPLRLRDADGYLLPRMEITKVRQLLNSRRLEWDAYLPRHPAYISLIESPQQRIAMDWKAEDHSTDSLHDSGIPSSRRSALGLRSAFNRAPS